VWRRYLGEVGKLFMVLSG